MTRKYNSIGHSCYPFSMQSGDGQILLSDRNPKLICSEGTGAKRDDSFHLWIHAVHNRKLLVYTTCFKTKLACAASWWNSRNTKTLPEVWHQWVLCSTLQAFVKQYLSFLGRHTRVYIAQAGFELNKPPVYIFSSTHYTYTHPGHVSAVLLILGTFYFSWAR